MTLAEVEKVFTDARIGFTFAVNDPIDESVNPMLIGAENRIGRSDRYPQAMLQAIGPTDHLLQFSGHATLGSHAAFNEAAMLVVTMAAKQVDQRAADWVAEVFPKLKFNRDTVKRRTFTIGTQAVRCTITYTALPSVGLFSFTALLE